MSADLCRRQSRLTGWPLWWRSDSGRVSSPPSAPLSHQEFKHVSSLETVRKISTLDRTQRADPKHLEQKHNGSIQ